MAYRFDIRVKPPAFQFYADDFLAGTMDMSQDEVGAYIRLLCHQWNRGSIPVATEKQQRLAGGSVSADVLSKFAPGPDGQLRNARMEAVREKAAHYVEQQRLKGIASAKQRLNRGSTAVQPSLQPEGNSPVSSLLLRERDAGARGTTIPTDEDVVAAGVTLGAPEPWLRQWHADRTTEGWADRHGVDIGNWRSYLVRAWRSHQNEIGKTSNGNNRANGRPGVNERPDRNVGTFNEGEWKKYEGVVRNVKRPEREAGPKSERGS